MIDILNPFGNKVSYAACIGLDWGHFNNCFHLLATNFVRHAG